MAETEIPDASRHTSLDLGLAAVGVECPLETGSFAPRQNLDRTRAVRGRKLIRARSATPSSSDRLQSAEPAECILTWPSDDQPRIRRIVSRARAIPTGKSHSLTLDRFTHSESSAERLGQKMADACVDVHWYAEQPLRISFIQDGILTHHVPDLLLHSAGVAPWLVEFKRDDDGTLELAMLRALHVAPLIQRIGYTYTLVLESTLKRMSYSDNCATILRYGRRALDTNAGEAARIAFETCGGLASIDDVAKHVGSLNVALSTVCNLLRRGYILAEMSEPIFAQKLRWRPRGESTGGLQWLRRAYGVIK